MREVKLELADPNVRTHELRVYVLSSHAAYEGGTVESVHATLEGAQRAATGAVGPWDRDWPTSPLHSVPQGRPSSEYWWEIDEFEVQV